MMAFDANELSQHEQFVVDRTRTGEIADYSSLAGPDREKPLIRAGFLRKLMLQLDEGWIVRAPGVRLKGARIEGLLDLTDCSGAGGAGLPALALVECAIADPIDISHARLARLSLRGSRLSRLTATQTQIDGELDLSEVAPCSETLTVQLRGTRINGDLLARAAKFARAPDGEEDALMLQGGDISGDLVLEHAKIAGQLVLQGARVGRNLDLRGAELSHRTAPRSDAYGRALDAASVAIGGAALFHGANIKGELFLPDARIQGYLAFGGGRYINGGGWAIRAPNARVGGNVTFKLAESGFAPLGAKTVIEGGAKFDRAQIEGAFAWAALELRGPGPDGAKGAVFSFADARISGPLQARNLVTQQDAQIDLSGASCAALDDDVKTGWGVEGAGLDLEGFAYGRIEAKDERWGPRLAWLKRSRREGERFSPQPFSQAAQVYARAGLREEARRILLAQHDLRTLRTSAGPLTWALSSTFGLVAGYGLAPLRIARALILFLALGVIGVLAMNAQGALVRNDGAACNEAVEPTLYAIDVALPVIDLGQQSRCAPGRTARAELSRGITIGDWRVFEAGALWGWAHALYTVLGAILTALAVLTFSGVMKPKEE